MERIKQFDIVGNASDDKKTRLNNFVNCAITDAESIFTGEELKEIKEAEREKSDLELVVIDFVNRKTNELMVKYGATPYNLGPNSYHIVSGDYYKKIHKTSPAICFPVKQVVFINEDECRRSNVLMGIVISHETLHAKSFLSFEANNNENLDFAWNRRRVGVVVDSSVRSVSENDEHQHFMGLDEAITERLSREIVKEIYCLPEFKKDKEAMLNGELDDLIEENIKDNGNSEESVAAAYGNNGNRMVHSNNYFRHINVMDYTCHEIMKNFPDRFKVVSDVFDEFYRAYFSGNILVIARLVDATFGEGGFRLLGEMGDDNNSAELCLNSLKERQKLKL